MKRLTKDDIAFNISKICEGLVNQGAEPLNSDVIYVELAKFEKQFGSLEDATKEILDLRESYNCLKQAYDSLKEENEKFSKRYEYLFNLVLEQEVYKPSQLVYISSELKEYLENNNNDK